MQLDSRYYNIAELSRKTGIGLSIICNLIQKEGLECLRIPSGKRFNTFVDGAKFNEFIQRYRVTKEDRKPVIIPIKSIINRVRG